MKFSKINFLFLQINDGDEYWGLRHLVNAAEQAEEFAIAIWHKLQSWKVKKKRFKYVLDYTIALLFFV
jgi:hypothetical protein